MPTPITSGGSQCFHGNDANNLRQRGHAGLKLFRSVFLHSAHSRGTSSGGKGLAQRRVLVVTTCLSEES
jgi:hypothetical protein